MDNLFLDFMKEHRINDGLLRELLYKEKFQAACTHVQFTIDRYKERIKRTEELKSMIETAYSEDAP